MLFQNFLGLERYSKVDMTCFQLGPTLFIRKHKRHLLTLKVVYAAGGGAIHVLKVCACFFLNVLASGSVGIEFKFT